MLSFHGYARQAVDFEVFEESLGHRYTIFSFDLFYHGPHAMPLESEVIGFELSRLSGMIEKILWETKKVKCSLMGYSLGGRVALAIMQKLPHRVKEAFLMAPDGLKTDIHEWLVTETFVGNNIYKHWIRKPGALFKLNSLLRKMGILNDNVYRFILSNIESEEQRLHVFRTWMAFRRIKPELSIVAHYIMSRKIRVELFFGKFDRIIKPSLGKRLTNKLNDKGKTHILECGHQVMKCRAEISDVILNEKAV